MVSMLDWSKLGRLSEQTSRGEDVVRSSYFRAKEEEVIKQAEEHGYFLVPSEEFLVQQFSAANGNKRFVYDLRYVKLDGVHMRKLGDICYCTNLRICILSRNFITKIEPLASCRQLMWLDLHKNQLTSLPGLAFWSGMRKLRLLNLHDNPIGRFDTLHSLAACPLLTALTLYDSPLSLKKNYRHHVVNTLWTLKALDFHVISDEEIIEDAHFTQNFKALDPSMKINLCPLKPGIQCYSDELRLLQKMEAKINSTMAKTSPVLIIQKNIRGYLCRRDGNFKPAVYAKMGLVRGPRFSGTRSQTPSESLSEMMMEHREDLASSIVMGSATPVSDNTFASVMRHVQHEDVPLPPISENNVTTVPHPTPVPPDSGVKRKNIIINLAKLETETLMNLQDEAVCTETIFPLESRQKTEEVRRSRHRKKKRAETERPRKKLMSIKHFFGPVVASTATAESEGEGEGLGEGSSVTDEEEPPFTEFRLRGTRPVPQLLDATAEMILSRREAGRWLRDFDSEYHRLRSQEPKPAPKHASGVTNDHRLFSRVHGTMGMSCLVAVQKAYKEREKAEKAASKMENILSLREERMRAKERINLYHEEKRNQALKRRDRDRARMMESLEKQELQRLNYLDRRQDLKTKATDLLRAHRNENTFIQEFNTQHTSVSNALLRHDRQSKREDEMGKRSSLVKGMKAVEQDQQETVRKYLEHRQLMRQSDTAKTRTAFDTRMLQEANDRLMENRNRVAQLKQRRETIQTFYPLPPNTVPAGTVSAPPGSNQWEAGVFASEGRIGTHPTMVV